MKSFKNVAISASAGTGKTWALSHRYIALMAAGVSPDSICALTFSRKAAGEIYESIVERLCRAATDDAERSKTRESMAKEIPGLNPPEDPSVYVGLLRRLLDASHRLRIGPLDSFMLGIVRAFPLELGIPPDCRPMDNEGSEALARRESLLMKLNAPSSGAADHRDDDTQAVLDAFRQATYGRAAKGLASTVGDGITEHYEQFLRHADRDWGTNPDLIWPRSTRWWESFGPEDRYGVLDPEFEETLKAVWGSGRGTQLADACLKLAKVAATQTRVSAWPEKLPSIFVQLIKQVSQPDLPVLDYYKKPYTFPETCWPSMRAALANLIGLELERTLKQTTGLRSLLEHYDALYHDARRTDGSMTFSDVTRLLCDSDHAPSREQKPDRLYIDYRLDGQLDHWLVDEFQDTSDEQWGAIANLVDEVAQDDNRSFFYVGDIKQSIYGWRQGNWRLFDRVRNHLGIEPRTLVESFRSRKAIVDTVNAIFAGLLTWVPELGQENGPHASAVKAFVGDKWPEHVSKTAKEGGDGFAALLEYVPEKRGSSSSDDDEDETGDTAQYRAVAGVLKSIPFQQKGLSVAVLVRSNEQGRTCADTLRRQLGSTPVVHEGVGGIIDSPVGTLLLALVRYAAHPADNLARRHLQISPLASHGFGYGCLSTLPKDLLASFHEEGFATTLREWGRKLESTGALREDDAFGHQRLRELLAAAEAFDATGSRDPDAFVDHIRGCSVKAQAAAGAVRVMTIHQSKGLGFDIVVVPFDPGARSFTNTKNVTLIMNHANDAGQSDDGWLIKTPKRAVLEGVNGAAQEAFDAARADANFDQLCALYVALTRAKSALYMLVPQLPKDPSSVREADLVREQLANESCGDAPAGLTLLYQNGEANWHERVGNVAGKSQASAAPVPMPAVPFVNGIVRREPSKEHGQGSIFPAKWLFQEEAGDIPAFGQALHRLFEGIEWLEDADVDAVVANWRVHSCETSIVLDDVERQFRSCLKQEEVRAALCRPAGATASEVWREAPFSLVRESAKGSELISGRFDRVVVTRDSAGLALAAMIVDFKSNRIDEESELAKTAEGYAAQMRDYADAAARLLQIAPDRIKAVLLFTRIGRAVQIGS